MNGNTPAQVSQAAIKLAKKAAKTTPNPEERTAA
jgi:hypothetical protein